MIEMRAFLIFDPSNDIVFHLADEKFFKHVTTVALRAGLIESPKEKISNDILIHLFAPLLTSQKIYKSQLNNPCACIQCDDNTLILFTEYLGYTIIYLCDSKPGREGTEKRRVNTLLQCVWQMYACALPQLRSDARGENDNWRLLSSIMRQYDDLKMDSFDWLVEASPYYPHSKDNQKLLEEILDSARRKANRDPLTFNHAFLYNGTQMIAEHHAKNALKLSTTDIFHLNLIVSTMPLNSHLPVFFSTNFNTAVPFMIFRVDTLSQATVILLAEMNELTARSDAIYALSRHINHIQGEVFKGEGIDNEHIEEQSKLITGMLQKVYRVMSCSPMKDEEKQVLATVELLRRMIFDSGLFREAVLDLNRKKETDAVFVLNQRLSHLQDKVTAAFTSLVLDPARNYQPDGSLFWFSVPHIVANISMSFDLRPLFAEHRELKGFIFVNRNANKCVYQLQDDNERVKRAVQRAWKKSERIVSEGKIFGFTWSDPRYTYRYDIWFESVNGKKVAPLNVVKEKSLPYPGVGAVNFYKLLTEQLFGSQSKNVACLELLIISDKHHVLKDELVSTMSSKMWNIAFSSSDKFKHRMGLF